MSRGPTVLYDACVLFPNTLRDFLVELAKTGLIQARWTELIYEEWIRNLLEKRPDLTLDKLTKVKDQMNQAVPGCLVEGFEPLIPLLALPDPDDRHVLAAAITAKADQIVTFNLKDFPREVLRPYGLEAISPDDFVLECVEASPTQVYGVVEACRGRCKRPSYDFSQYLDVLHRQGLPQSVEDLRLLSGSII